MLGETAAQRQCISKLIPHCTVRLTAENPETRTAFRAPMQYLFPCPEIYEYIPLFSTDPSGLFFFIIIISFGLSRCYRLYSK